MKNHKNSIIGSNVHAPKSPLKVRELPPKLAQGKDGTAQILCPFCVIPHPILPGQDSACGTSLKVTAVQVVIPARIARLEKLTCLKCHKSEGGEMVRYQGGFVHLADCMPGTRLLAQPPEFSGAAKFVFGLPKAVRARIEKRTGRAQQVKEIDPEGHDTGKVLGYFFLKTAA